LWSQFFFWAYSVFDSKPLFIIGATTMPGIQNTSANGLYSFIQPLIVNGAVVVGGTLAPQKFILGDASATICNAAIDTTATIHPVTISLPSDPGAIIGTTCGPAKAVSGYSRTMMIKGKPALQNGTKKFQNTGNCPISPMVSATNSKTYCYVSS